ncbi:MAG: hypothetical protein ABDI19_07680, partial [Armatimonadota bacterium]
MRQSRGLRQAWVLAIVALCTLSEAQTVDLSKDERLQKSLTLHEPLIPLKQLLTQIGKELNVNLSATAEIAEDKVCVLVHERPAYEVLQRLADTLRYEWQVSEATGGYRLYQPHGERVREQQLRQALLQAHRQRMERALRVMIDLARRHPWEELAKSSGRGAQRFADEQRRLLARLSDVSLYAATRVMGDFRASEWQRFWQGETLVFSSAPQMGELPLAPELRHLILEGLFAIPERPSSETARRDAREVVMRLHWDGWRGTMTVVTESRSVAPSRRAAEGLAGTSVGITATVRTLSTDELADTTRSQAKSAALLDDYFLNKVWREWANVSDRLTPSRRDTPPKCVTLPEYLQRSPLAALIEAAYRYGLDLYADAYRIELFLETLPATRALLLHKTLPSDWSELHSMFWLRQEGDALMARHKDYFWLRPSEIPEEWLQPLETKKQKGEKLVLDDWAQLANLLNELQVERLTGLPLTTYTYARTVSTLNLRTLAEAVPALRFWASLTPQQKQAALSGELLLLRQLTPTQRQRFQQALYARIHPTRTFMIGHRIVYAAPKTVSIYHDQPESPPSSPQEPHFTLTTESTSVHEFDLPDTPLVVFSQTGEAVTIPQPKQTIIIFAQSSHVIYVFQFVFEGQVRHYTFSPAA